MIDASRIAYIGRHAGLLREIAHGVKDGDAKYADMAARLFDAALPSDCVIVPMPGHRGRADTMLDVALRVSAMSGRAVLDALACVPHESSYAQKARGGKPTPIAMYAKFAVHGKIIIIDNCIASGVTASAALYAIPAARVCAITISATQREHQADTTHGEDECPSPFIQPQTKGTHTMKIDTDTFYVVANISGGYRNPTFTHWIGTGTTDAWGDAATADHFDTRKEAEAFIRSEFDKASRHQYKPMRVRIETKLYN